jgi:hypothetical protein
MSLECASLFKAAAAQSCRQPDPLRVLWGKRPRTGENRGDIWCAVAAGLEHLAIVTQHWAAMLVKLAHVGPVDFGDDRIQVDPEGDRRTVGDVGDVGERVGDANKVASLCRLSELANLLLQQRDSQLNQLFWDAGKIRRRRPWQPKRHMEVQDQRCRGRWF